MRTLKPGVIQGTDFKSKKKAKLFKCGHNTLVFSLIEQTNHKITYLYLLAEQTITQFNSEYSEVSRLFQSKWGKLVLRVFCCCCSF